MNLGLSSTPLRALALISFASFQYGMASASAATKPYENFDLPKAEQTAPQSAGLNYDGRGLKLSGKVRTTAPSFNAQSYVFAKESFLTEKRDEAIKLLRQQMDAGLSRNRDNLLLRLGQLYSEKYMELSYRETELYTKQIEEYEAKRATQKSIAAPKLDNSRSQAYLKQAFDLFVAVEKEFPRHPKMDEILFFIGFVDLEYGRTDKGLRYLNRVIREFPKSRKFDEAVLYIADHHFEKAKFREALGKYRILAAKKDSPLFYYAQYKIAWCQLNTFEQRQAIQNMKALIAGLSGNQEPAKFNLREQAFRDLVIFYGETGDVDDAVEYFTENVGKEKAMANLRVLADLLRAKARDEAAIKAYERLLDDSPDSIEAPKLMVGLSDVQAKTAKTKQSVETLVKALETYGPGSSWAKTWNEKNPAGAKEGSDELSHHTVKLAFFYHSSAQKSANKTSRALALALYRALLAHYPNHPERKKIAFYTGEILFADGKWIDAANAYMLAAKIPPKEKVADEAAYNAILALDHLTAKNEKLNRYAKDDKKVSLEPEEIPEAETKFIEVAEFYLKEYPQGTRVVDVQFRIAAIYYQYHHFDKSQAMFRDIALKHPRHRSSTTAANIVLDIYNLKKDYAALDATAVVFAKTEGLGDKAFRAEMAKLSSEISFKKLEALEKDNKWREAGDAYFTFYKANPNADLAEKSLHNAQVSYEKAGDLSKAAEVTKLFIAKYPKSEYTKQNTLTLAKQSEKAYDFELAQKWYQEFSEKFPQDKEAKKALYNAAVFAELLDKNKVALNLYDEYLKTAKPTAEERRSILVSQAKLNRKESKWDRVNALYRQMIREARSNEERFSLLGELARQFERGGRVADRDKVLNELRYQYDIWKIDPKSARVTGPAFQYLAEARFKALAPARERYEKIQLRFPPEDLVYLLKTKQKLLAKLAASYDGVVDIGVPEWGVAALYEKSEAFENFALSFKKVQIPAKYKDAERTEIETQLKAIEAKLVTPVAQKAIDVATACAKRGSDFYVASEYAAKCRSRVDKSKLIEHTGIVPQPSYWTTRWLNGEGVAKR